jgi:hypothetical protein
LPALELTSTSTNSNINRHQSFHLSPHVLSYYPLSCLIICLHRAVVTVTYVSTFQQLGRGLYGSLSCQHRWVLEHHAGLWTKQLEISSPWFKGLNHSNTCFQSIDIELVFRTLEQQMQIGVFDFALHHTIHTLQIQLSRVIQVCLMHSLVSRLCLLS